MRRLLLILCCFTILFAGEDYELKLYEKVLPLLFSEDSLKVYGDSEAKEILDESKILVLTRSCNDATLLIGKNFDDLESSCKNKPIFATSYRAFTDLESSFGAFYWRKGRPQIKFNSSNIKKFNLFLPNNLQRYAQ